MTFKEEVLDGFWCALSTAWAEQCIQFVDVVEVPIEAYMTGLELKEEGGLDSQEGCHKLEPSTRRKSFVNCTGLEVSQRDFPSP